MGYDLIFWCQGLEETADPAEILRRIADDGAPPMSLKPLPIDDMITRILTAFPEAVREPNGAEEWVVWEPPTAAEMFELHWSDRHLWATLRGSWRGETANQLIDIALQYGCPLYDPQSGERFA